MKAGKTPLPAVWALETTLVVNSDFQGVRYYVKNQEDCLKHFGVSLLDSPVCHLQSERSWTESKIVSTHVISSMCGVVNQNKSNDYAQLKQRFISREAINFFNSFDTFPLFYDCTSSALELFPPKMGHARQS